MQRMLCMLYMHRPGTELLINLVVKHISRKQRLTLTFGTPGRSTDNPRGTPCSFFGDILIVVRSGRPYSPPPELLWSTELPVRASRVMQVLYIQWYSAQCYTIILWEVC